MITELVARKGKYSELAVLSQFILKRDHRLVLTGGEEREREKEREGIRGESVRVYRRWVNRQI